MINGRTYLHILNPFNNNVSRVDRLKYRLGTLLAMSSLLVGSTVGVGFASSDLTSKGDQIIGNVTEGIKGPGSEKTFTVAYIRSTADEAANEAALALGNEFNPTYAAQAAQLEYFTRKGVDSLPPGTRIRIGIDENNNQTSAVILDYDEDYIPDEDKVVSK